VTWHEQMAEYEEAVAKNKRKNNVPGTALAPNTGAMPLGTGLSSAASSCWSIASMPLQPPPPRNQPLPKVQMLREDSEMEGELVEDVNPYPDSVVLTEDEFDQVGAQTGAGEGSHTHSLSHTLSLRHSPFTFFLSHSLTRQTPGGGQR
jgi:hypothetical protein